jgi:nicotinamidase-related amidase
LSGSICDAARAIHSAVAPKDNDVIVMKHRTGAFAGTELDFILRANGIQTPVLAGITIGGVVLSTLSHAADADYRVIVVEDCCSDHDMESHRILVKNVFPCRATVVSLRDLVSEL